MNTLSVLRGELGVLRQEMAVLTEKLEGVEVSEDGNLSVRGSIEVVANDEGDMLPTVVAGGMIYTDELRCDQAQIQNLRVHGLEVLGDAPVLGPTGCRGPPGYATHTGATGPAGDPCKCLQTCRLVRGSPPVRRQGVWCHELGEAVFATRLQRGGKIQIMLGIVGGGTLRVELLFLTPNGDASNAVLATELQVGTHYQEAWLKPVVAPEGGSLLQVSVSSTTTAHIAHVSVV